MVSFPFSLVITVLHFLHCILPLGEGRLIGGKGINCMSTNMAIKELESTKGGPEGKLSNSTTMWGVTSLGLIDGLEDMHLSTGSHVASA